MELLSMENLKENNKNFVKGFLREYGDIEKANELILFFGKPEFKELKTWPEVLEAGYIDELNEILGNK